MDREIIIRSGETEITMNEQAISISAPGVLVTVMTDGESSSVTTATKDRIISQVQQSSREKSKEPFSFNVMLDGKAILPQTQAYAREFQKRIGQITDD